MVNMQMTGAQMVLKALEDQQVDTIFGYPGGAVLPIYDELAKTKDTNHQIRHFLVRHEQGASHAAEGYARSSGKVGVMLVTSGPGVTNAVTGLTDAMMDSIPLVCISGQVPTHLIGTDAFQECDAVGITRPCTKHNWLVKDINDLSRILHEAFYVASSGRPGPVLVDIPKDIQFQTGTYIGPDTVKHKSYRPKLKANIDNIDDSDGGNQIVICKVNPRDVVSVPSDSKFQKLRCCEYEVVSLFNDIFDKSVHITDCGISKTNRDETWKHAIAAKLENVTNLLSRARECAV
mgnify:CR=1 FL=1